MAVDLAVTSVCVVVSDIEASMQSYAEILGISTWSVADESGVPALVDGMESSVSYTSARGTMCSGLEVELIEPAPDGSSFHRQRLQRGDGVHHLTIGGAKGEIAALVERLGCAGVGVYQDLGRGAEQWFATRDVLGGWLLKIGQSTSARTVRSRVPVRQWMRPQHLVHFGIVVRDVSPCRRPSLS